MVGVWVYMLAYILASYNCIATVTATRKSQKNSLSSLQVIAKENDTDRGTAGWANLLTATDMQLPKDLAAENETFPAVRKLEGLWDLHRFNTLLWHKVVVLLAVFLQYYRWICLQIVTTCSNQGVHLQTYLDGIQLFDIMHSLNLQFSEVAINCIAKRNETRHSINTGKCEWEHTETLGFHSQCNSEINFNVFSAETAIAKLGVT